MVHIRRISSVSKATLLSAGRESIFSMDTGYADLILNGDPKESLKNVAGSHGLED